MSGSRRGRPQHPRQKQVRVEPRGNEPRFEFRVDQIHLSLLKILREDGDVSYSRRINATNQLASWISQLSRSEIAQAGELLLGYGNVPGLEAALEDNRAPESYLQAVAQCISFIGVGLGIEAGPYFQWIVEHLSWNTPNAPLAILEKEKEKKKWLLVALGQTIENASVNGSYDPESISAFQHLIANVLYNLQVYLNSSDSMDCFTNALDVMEIIARKYPTVFAVPLQEIVDLLIGWYIDISVPSAVKVKISDLFISLDVCWRNHLPFAIQLLNHFLNEMETSFVTYKADGELVTYFSLLRCFQLIFHAITPHIGVDPISNDETLPYRPTPAFFDELERIRAFAIKLIYQIGEGYKDYQWMSESNHLIVQMSKPRKRLFFHLQVEAMKCMLMELDMIQGIPPPESQTFVVLWLRKFTELIHEWKPRFHPTLLPALLEPKSSFMKTRFLYQGDSRIRNGILDILQLMIQSVSSSEHANLELGLTNPVNAIIKEGVLLFRCYIAEHQPEVANRPEFQALEDMLYSMEGAKIVDTRNLIEGSQEETTQLHGMDPKLAHTIFIMNGLILAEIVQKSSFYFDRVFYYVIILFLKTPDSTSTSIDQLRNGMLLTLEQICQSQNNFVFNPNHDNHTLCTVSENRLELVTNLIGVIIRARETHLDTKCIAVSWIGKIIDSFQNHSGARSAPSLFYKQTTYLIIDLLNQHNRDLIFRRDHLNIIKEFVIQCGDRVETEPIFNKLLEWSYVSDPRARSELTEILSHFDPLLTMSFKGTSENPIFETFKTCVRSIPHLGTFRPQHFQIVMDYLGMKSSSDQGRKHDAISSFTSDWRERLFHSCQAVDGLNHTSFFSDLKKDLTEGEVIRMIESSEEMLTYWALWEAARYCVLARSRTPFGAAQQTFEVFEKALVSALSSGITTNGTELQRIRDLVVFIDFFEFQIYNAAVGTAVSSIPLAPRASILFFRTNLKVCEDWFIRNRRNIVHVSNKSGATCSLIRHSIKFIHEQTIFIGSDILKNSQRINDIIEVLTIVIPLLVKAGDEDGVNGLLNSCREIFTQFRNQLNDIIGSVKENVGEISIMPRGLEEKREEQAQARTIMKSLEDYQHFEWLLPSMQLARGNIESSVKESIRLYDATENSTIKSFLAKQIYECYSQVSDWKAMAEWAPTMDIISGCESYEHYAKALGYFDAKDYDQSKRELSELPLISSTTELATPQELTRKLQPTLLNTIVNKIGSETKFEEPQLNKILDDSLNLLSKESFQDFASPLVVLQFLSLFRMGSSRLVFDLSNIIPEIDYIHHDLLRVLAYHRLPESILRLSSDVPVSEIKPIVDRIALTTAKLARECMCLETAESILKNLRSTECFEILFEDAILTFQLGQVDCAVKKMTESIQKVEISSHDKSRVALKIAEWFGKSSISNDMSQEILSLFDSSTLNNSRAQSYTVQGESEPLKLASYNFAIHHNSDNPQAWRQYAQYLDDSIVNVLTQKEPYNLPAVETYLKNGLEESIYNSMFSERHGSFKQKFFLEILQKTQSDDFSWVDGHLHEYQHSLSHTDLEIIKNAIGTWYASVRHDFGIIVQAYFRFLSSCASQESEKRSQSRDGLTCALRILKILFKYGGHLKDVFEEQSLINAWPWDQIVPQLFAGLQHPDQYVQDFTTKILCMLAAASPQAVAYHAIVESLSASDEKRKSRSKAIVEALHRNNDQVVNEITMMISEFRRIAVLWEDLWSDKIAHLQPELARKAQQLKIEFEKIEQNKVYSSSEKEQVKSDSYSAIFQSVIITLEKLCDVTIDRTPCTPREEWFIEKFKYPIKDAIENLKIPKPLKKIKDAWEKFKEIGTKLSKEFMRGKTLKLADVSPYLARIKDSNIHIPGLSASEEEITIHSIREEILVIPTKTKPKKLVFVGSDGKNYGYLFKGLEDLHLDERMMQILRITNRLLKRDPESNRRSLRARNYGVIPLDNHSGMIQWVDNTSTLFTLYRKWQYREAASNIIMQPQEQADSKAPPAHPSKPNDVFYEKVAAALKDAGVSISLPRKNWPIEVLRKVYLDLVSETPSTLLEKELWASCSTSSAWYKKSKSFIRSLAVMSVIGYIIGLGDRHLDNILIDFVQGEIIHIDYNICFEKGKRLRIPETVPFRLTRNFQAALGIFGVDGYFKQAGSHSLRVLRENQKTLLTLLDAFVYDPLLDWSQDSQDDKDERPLEVSVNLGLLASRMAKFKEELETHRQKLAQSLASIETTADSITSAIENIHTPYRLTSDGPSEGSMDTTDEDLQLYVTSLREFYNECKSNHENITAAFEKFKQETYSPSESESSLGFSEFTSNLDSNSPLAHELSTLESNLQQWDQEQIALRIKCSEHLEHYKEYIAGPASILEQDFYLRWSKIIEPLLLSDIEYRSVTEALDRYEELKPPTSSKLTSWQNLLSQAASDTTKLQQVYGQLISYLDNQLNRDQVKFVGKDQHDQLNRVQLGASWTALVELYQLFENYTNDVDVDILAVVQQKFGIRSKCLPDTELVKDVDTADILTYILRQLVEILRDHTEIDDTLKQLGESVARLTKLPQVVFSFETNLLETIIPQIFSLHLHSPKIFTSLESSLNEIMDATSPEELGLSHEINVRYLDMLDRVGDVEVADGVRNFEKNFNEVLPWVEVDEQTVSSDYKARIFKYKLQLLSQIFSSVRMFTQYHDDVDFALIPPICVSEVFKNKHTTEDIFKTMTLIRRNILLEAHNRTMAQICKNAIGAIMRTLEASMKNIVDNENANKNLVKHFVSTGVCTLPDIHAERAIINQYIFETFKEHKLHVITHRKQLLDRTFSFQTFYFAKFQWLNKPYISGVNDVKVVADLIQDTAELQSLRTTVEELAHSLQEIETKLTNATWSNLSLNVSESLLQTVRHERNLLETKYNMIQAIGQSFDLMLKFENMRAIQGSNSDELKILEILKTCQTQMKAEREEPSSLHILEDVVVKMQDLKLNNVQENMHKLMGDIGWLYTSMEEILNEISGLVKVLYNQTNKKPEVRAIHQRFKAFMIVYSDFSYYFDTLFEALEALFGNEHNENQMKLSELNDNIRNIMERKTDAELALKKLFVCLYALCEDRDEPEIYRILDEDAGSGIDEWDEDFKEVDNKSSTNRTSGLVENEDIDARNRQNYAMNVIDRIRRKLSGLDGDKGAPMTVEEQVDYIYEQATSTDNLCVMYEGWTAWI